MRCHTAKSNFLKCIWVFCGLVHLCTPCMPRVGRGQKRPLDPMELELQVVMSCLPRGSWELSPRSSGRTLAPKSNYFKYSHWSYEAWHEPLQFHSWSPVPLRQRFSSPPNSFLLSPLPETLHCEARLLLQADLSRLPFLSASGPCLAYSAMVTLPSGAHPPARQRAWHHP